ncbi:MAG: hypothetical protein RLZ35_378 [Pseudomonadota bacterium]
MLSDEIASTSDSLSLGTLAVCLAKYWQQQQVASQSLLSRLNRILPLFIGKAYCWEALGEGVRGVYSQAPLFRFDAFDCVTFVNTVLSLIYSDNFSSFEKNLRDIRYIHGQIDYRQRTDWFTDLEWNPRATSLGWLRDITHTVLGKHQAPLFKVAETIIDKKGWYAARTLEDLHLGTSIGLTEKKARLKRLQAEGLTFLPQKSQLSYIPLSACLDGNNDPIPAVWAQFPSAYVLQIVRPDWAIKDNWIDPQGRVRGYGTNLNVSHLGIVVTDVSTKTPIFYHASRVKNTVVSIPLRDYLQSYVGHETIKGIHIEAILDSPWEK